MWHFFKDRSIMQTPMFSIVTDLKTSKIRYFSLLDDNFRKSYSCQTLLIKFLEDRKATLGEGHGKGTFYMDVSKAFDCLPHSLLMTKLHAYGLFEAACETMFYYLQDREQRITLIFLIVSVLRNSKLRMYWDLFCVMSSRMTCFSSRKKCKLDKYPDDNLIMCIFSGP